jgi:hypothetical protein
MKNEAVVKGLRELADFLEARPDLEKVDFTLAHGYMERRVGDVRERFARNLRAIGSCKKSFDDNYVSADVEFSGNVKLSFRIERGDICKKIVTWDCGDASFLKEIGMDADEAGVRS